MQQLLTTIIIAALSYFLGSINASIMISKLAYRKDIRQFGSGNGGLTNAYRTMGGKPTLAVFAIDFAKGLISCTIGGLFFGLTGKLIAGAFVLLGHIFPAYFKFKGGKGVLTGAALAFSVDWKIFCILIFIFIVVTSITRWVSLGSICATAAFPICMFFIVAEANLGHTIFALCIALLVIIKHRLNIKRILAGTESKFQFRNKDSTKMTRD